MGQFNFGPSTEERRLGLLGLKNSKRPICDLLIMVKEWIIQYLSVFFLSKTLLSFGLITDQCNFNGGDRGATNGFDISKQFSSDEEMKSLWAEAVELKGQVVTLSQGRNQ